MDGAAETMQVPIGGDTRRYDGIEKSLVSFSSGVGNVLLGSFCWVAAVDPQILRRCPTTDKVWATQLGAWLLVSFCTVFIIALHSTNYVPQLEAYPILRVVVAALIALTIFLFDRALYQSDWFRHGYFNHDGPAPVRKMAAKVAMVARIAARLAISLFMAFSLGMFLELAVFSGAIADRLHHEHRKANARHFAKLRLYSQAQEEDLAEKRRGIAALQNEITAVLRAGDDDTGPADPRLSDIDRQQERLVQHERQLSADMRAKRREISDRRLEAVCETEGTKLDRARADRCSGVPSCGPRCRAAKHLVKVHEDELTVLQAQMEAITEETRRLSLAKDNLLAEAKEDRARRRALLEHRRNSVDAEIGRRRAELVEFEAAMPIRIQSYAQALEQSSGYVELRDDPLMRLRALEMLKADPDYGAVFTLYSWTLKLLVMFLEVVPVLGKIFFAPPSAYAIHVQKRVERYQRLDLEVCEAERQSGQEWDQPERRQPDGPCIGRAREGVPRRRHLTVAATDIGVAAHE
jgi:hypothetical protein